eukprot:gene9532-12840_t
MTNARNITVIGILTVSSLLAYSNAQLLSKILQLGGKKKSFQEQVELIDNVLDDIELKSTQVSTFVSHNSHYLQILSGGLMIMYGGLFPNLMLILQAVRHTSLPQLLDNINELKGSYFKTRSVIKKEMSDIIKAKDSLDKILSKQSKLIQDIHEIESLYSSNKIDKKEFENKISKLQIELNDITEQLKKISASSNIITQVTTAVDPTHIKSIIGSIYHSLSAGIAAVSHQTLGHIAIGMQFGHTLANRLIAITSQYITSHRLHSHIENVDAKLSSTTTFGRSNKEWLHMTIQVTSAALGMILMYSLKKTAMVFSACTLGSSLIIDASHYVLDPYLQNNKLPTLKSSPVVTSGVQSALVGIGLYAALRPGGNHLPIILKALFAPLFGLELLIENIFGGKNKIL